MKQQPKLLRLVESALMLAVATVLSLVKLLDLPYGGSITVCSALPILLVAYRHGTGFGLLTGFAHAAIQLLLGTSTLSYATSAWAAVAIILLDYLLAFTVLGLSGVFRRRMSQTRALVWGAALTGGLRYILHVIAGCTVWAGLSIPTTAALWYSLGYNATYMLPETLVNVLGVWYLSRALDLSKVVPARAPAAAPLSRGALVLSLSSAAVAVVTAVWDILLVFRHLQDEETGDFIITGLARVNWPLFAMVTVAGVAVTAVLYALSRRAAKSAAE